MIETNFKHTDWIPVNLGQLCTVWGRIGFRGYTKADLVRKGEGAITFSPSDIHDQKIDYSDCDYISLRKYEESPEIKVFNGDIIFCKTASIGKCAIIENLTEKATINPQFVVLKDFKCSNYFLYYKLIEKAFQTQVLSITGGSTIPTMSQEKLKEMQFFFPPTLAEQERIADALSKIDSLIVGLDELLEKKRAIKSGTMQQLLTGKKRLKGFTGEWDEKTIEELGDLTGAGVDKKSYQDETPVRLVNYLDVFRRDYIYNNELDFWVTAKETKKIQCNVLRGDVFFTPSSEMPYDIALSAVAMEDMPNVCYSYHIYRLRFREDIDELYRAYMFKSKAFYEQANQTCEGSGKRYVISLTKFKQMTVYYPSDKGEQHAIASILSAMDTEIASLEQKRDKYIAIKQGMMQQLLTGKIRLV